MMLKRPESELYVETKYEIIFEDAYFLVINKPSPLPVHPVGRFKEKNLLSILKRDLHCNEFRIVNRLDSETSGLVIVAKSSEHSGKLGKLFEKRQIEKEYHAVVVGCPPKMKGSIDKALVTERRGMQNLRIVGDEGETALTDYEVLERYEQFSLLRIIPRTGRTHQIRAHLAHIGAPIVGDKIYIDSQIFERYVREGWVEEMRSTVLCERLLLHASSLSFEHPFTGVLLNLAAPIPDLFQRFIRQILV